MSLFLDILSCFKTCSDSEKLVVVLFRSDGRVQEEEEEEEGQSLLFTLHPVEQPLLKKG